MHGIKGAIGEPAPPPLITPRFKGASKCDHPKCPSCILSKQHKRTPGSVLTSPIPDRQDAISQGDLNPGDCVSIDQYKSPTPGRLANTYGKEQESKRYSCGTIFVDHASGFTYVSHQVSTTVGETIQSKRKFERLLLSYGVVVRGYRADNNPFGFPGFKEECDLLGQTLTFSGVGAKFQNGRSERMQGTLVRWARSAMMHQLIHWPAQLCAPQQTRL